MPALTPLTGLISLNMSQTTIGDNGARAHRENKARIGGRLAGRAGRCVGRLIWLDGDSSGGFQ